MAILSSSPRILKGAFVRFTARFPKGQIITFQYNPEKIYRTLKVLTNGHFPHQSPKEVITFTLMLDSSDELEFPTEHQETVKFGIYPSLSALEMLLYPHKPKMARKSFFGMKWPSKPDKKAFTLLIWGDKRIIPIIVTELHIIEKMFDPTLNPIRATIKIKIRVLNDLDLTRSQKGYDYWKSHIAKKIEMAELKYEDTSMSSLKDPE